MFTRIFKPRGATKHWLGPAHPHLYNLTLENVTDPFDADAIWDDQYSGDKGILNIEGDSSQRRKRLKNALDDHRVTIPENDRSGRLLGKTCVYTDVVVWISKQNWLEDMAAGSSRIKMLAHNLARNHHRDFESSLHRSRYPSYVVMPHAKIGRSQVQFQFGRGVFVPKLSDQWIAKLQFELLVRDYDLKDKRQINPWLYFLDGKRRSERYIGLYTDQQSLIITIDSLLAKDVQSPHEFKENDGYLLINQLENKNWECFYFEDNQLNQLHVSSKKDGSARFIYPNGKLLINHRPVQFALHMGIHPLSENDVKKYVKMANIDMEAENDKAKGVAQEKSKTTELSRSHSGIKAQRYDDLKPRSLEESYAQFGVTIIPGKNSPKMIHSHALVAEGIALPRIDNDFEIKGLKSWSLWLDGQGNPINNPEIDPTQSQDVTTLSANNKSSTFFYRPMGSKHFVPVEQLPLTVNTQNTSIEVVESLFKDWFGFLQFANPFAYALEEAQYIIGRYNPDPSAEQADIQLDQLTHPNSLEWDNRVTARKATFTNLGLSRHHALLELHDDRLSVNLASGHRMHYLNKSLNDGKCIEAGNHMTLTLESGDRILIGNYLLRFDSLLQTQ